VDVIYW